MRIDPQGAKKWERRRPVPLSTGHLPDRPQLDGYSKGGENLRARREAVKYLIIQTLIHQRDKRPTDIRRLTRNTSTPVDNQPLYRSRPPFPPLTRTPATEVYHYLLLPRVRNTTISFCAFTRIERASLKWAKSCGLVG